MPPELRCQARPLAARPTSSSVQIVIRRCCTSPTETPQFIGIVSITSVPHQIPGCECGMRGFFRYCKWRVAAKFIERCSRRGLEIVDPALGRRNVTWDEAEAEFSRLLLEFAPTPEFEVRRRSPRPIWLSYVATHIVSSTAPIIQVCAVSILILLLGGTLPIITRYIFDDLLVSRSHSALLRLAAVLTYISAFFGASLWLRSLLLVRLTATLDERLAGGVVDHLFRLPYAYFQQRIPGDLLARLGSTTLIRETITGSLMSIVLDSLLALGYLGIIFLSDRLVGCAAVGLGLCFIALPLIATRRLRDAVAREISAQIDVQSLQVEAISSIATLMACGAETSVRRRWTALYAKQVAASVRRGGLQAQVDALVGFLRMYSSIALLLVGVWSAIERDLSAGTVLALNALGLAFLLPVGSIVSTIQRYQLIGAYLARIGDILEAEPEDPPGRRLLAHSIRGAVSCENVGFQYDADGPPVFSGVSFTVNVGERIGIVGPSGSGKSTLAMLLVGLLRPTSGVIRFDGVDVVRLDRSLLRRQIGTVLQEPALLGGTIADNIRLVNPDASVGDIRLALRRACLEAEVGMMPSGIETIVRNGAVS